MQLARALGAGTTRRMVLAAMLLALGALAGAAQDPKSAPRAGPQAGSTRPEPGADPRAEALRAACVAFAREHGVVGMGVAVLEGDRVVLDAPIGFADREADLAAQATTLYRLGSISKPVCATLALQLVQEQRLALDGPVGARVRDLPAALQPLTLAQLLSHTSGVRHYAFGRADNGTRHRTTAEALRLFAGDELRFAPGSKYGYSTHAYTLVVAAIEAATEREYPAVLRERLRKVAPSLDCEVASDAKPQRAALYDLDRSGTAVRSGEREDNSWKYGGGGLESTALDLARFGRAVLAAELVSAETRDAMWKPTPLSDGTTSAYGLGWRLAPDGKTVFHSGSQQGCHSMLLVAPEARRVISVLTNTQGCGAPALAQELQAQLAQSSK